MNLTGAGILVMQSGSVTRNDSHLCGRKLVEISKLDATSPESGGSKVCSLNHISEAML